MIVDKKDLNVLALLIENGDGAGVLDVHGRVCTGPTRKAIIADPTSWLRLVAAGLVAGEHGKILVTEEGRAQTVRLVGGYVAGRPETAA